MNPVMNISSFFTYASVEMGINWSWIVLLLVFFFVLVFAFMRTSNPFLSMIGSGFVCSFLSVLVRAAGLYQGQEFVSDIIVTIFFSITILGVFMLIITGNGGE